MSFVQTLPCSGCQGLLLPAFLSACPTEMTLCVSPNISVVQGQVLLPSLILRVAMQSSVQLLHPYPPTARNTTRTLHTITWKLILEEDIQVQHPKTHNGTEWSFKRMGQPQTRSGTSQDPSQLPLPYLQRTPGGRICKYLVASPSTSTH